MSSVRKFKVPEITILKTPLSGSGIVKAIKSGKSTSGSFKAIKNATRRSLCFSPDDYKELYQSPNISPISKFTPQSVSNFKDNKYHPRKLFESPFVKNQNNSILNKTISVCNILKTLKLTKYSDLFRREEIDYEIFLTLTKEDLVQLGVSVADQGIILRSVYELNQS